MQLLSANNAQSTLAGSISDSTTTLNVASGGGAQFPNPVSGQQYFVITLTDAATGLLNEIMWCTARIGDTFTVVRGKETTTPLAWTANDLVSMLWTAGQVEALVQDTEAQQQPWNYAPDTGSTNDLIAAFSPVLAAAPSAGTPFRVLIANTNTGAMTANFGWGAVAVVRRDGTACLGNEVMIGVEASFLWNGTALEVQGSAPATAAAVTAGTDTQSFITPAQLTAALGVTKQLTGQCYMQYTSTIAITLLPFNGRNVPVNGGLYQLPSAGIAAANTNIKLNGVAAQNLGASADYLVGLNETGALEYWTLGTGYTRDTTSDNIGIYVITGHLDVTLVGMVRTNASSEFEDSAGFRHVISWFNRRRKASKTNFTGNPTATTIAELSSTIRNSFLTWGEDAVPFSFTGMVSVTGSAIRAYSSVAFDGTTPEVEAAVFTGMATSGEGSSLYGNQSLSGSKSGLSAGRHYATVIGLATSSTATWQGGTGTIAAQAPAGTLNVETMG